MNKLAHKRMTDFAQKVIEMKETDQNNLFAYFVNSGTLTAEQAKGLREYVALYHIFSDADYYNAIQKALCEKFVDELYK
ncbi:MAG: hypothetical protein PUF72_05480 [Clostridiales bacterium]|nr:hypothetical protein [Clostridiales bacterium]